MSVARCTVANRSDSYVQLFGILKTIGSSVNGLTNDVSGIARRYQYFLLIM